MAASTVNPRSPAIALRRLPMAAGEGYLLPVTKFPIPEQEFSRVREFFQALQAQLASRWDLSPEVFIQLEQFEDDQPREVFYRHAQQWIPEVGLGVWPDREPPRVWTLEEFTECALASKRPRPLMFQVFQITGSPEAKIEAHERLLEFGSLVEYLSSEDPELLLQRTTAALLPAIQDPTYTCFPFYVPLLEVKALVGATTEMLESWIGQNSVYIRESFEDCGILIASLLPIEQIMAACGGKVADGSPKNA